MIIAAVPCKSLDLAKGRLSAILGPEERRALAVAMLTDVLAALGAVTEISKRVVVTRSPEIMVLARGLGAESWDEPDSRGYSEAVAFAQGRATELGARAFLTLAGDVPLVTADEVRGIIERLPSAPGALFVPSNDEQGTNGVLLHPPGSMRLRFGEPSFDNHVAESRRLGLHTTVLRAPGIGLDIDRPSDLLAFLKAPSSTCTYRTIAPWGLHARLADHDR